MQDKAKSADILPFARLGNSNGPSDGGCWIKEMVNGTRFLAVRKSEVSSLLHDFVVASDPKSMPAIFLGEELNTREGAFRWRDPIKFCRDYDLFMTLEVVEMKDGNTNSLQTGRMEGDGQPEIVSPVHEKE